MRTMSDQQYYALKNFAQMYNKPFDQLVMEYREAADQQAAAEAAAKEKEAEEG